MTAAPQATVTLTINNKPITVPQGTTVMEATRKIGVDVPHFCWHPGLSIAGVCRFCMVKIEGMPKLQIACNTTATEGMKVDTVSDEVKDSHKWALEFHLINHPLDCPICDQAGECELQNYYMKVGKYQSQMEEDKVLKPKVLDVGTTLVLDTERCILCSRCVRFEDEVTKTSTLGIFNRGDRSVIDTFKGRKIEHNYSYNLADICPVGAFTAKDFRFKCRVWFLSETPSVCAGCSTGCNVTLYQNKNQRQYYRLKPRVNLDVNGYWMCDYGRTMFEHMNADSRMAAPTLQGKATAWPTIESELEKFLAGAKNEKLAVVFTPQYTNEEYEAVLSTLKTKLGSIPKVFIWRDGNENVDAFDGILLRGDRNPNTAGLMQTLKAYGVTATVISKDFGALAAEKPTSALVFGPEIEKSYSDFSTGLSRFSEIGKVVYFGTSLGVLSKKFWMTIPTKVFSEKSGSFTNYKGITQRLKANAPVFATVRSVDEVFRANAAATRV